jgi:hypothetical protein
VVSLCLSPMSAITRDVGDYGDLWFSVIRVNQW